MLSIIVSFYKAFFDPFIEYSFMLKALIACTALSIGGAPIGLILILRRMSLVGEAFSHGIFPGIVIAFLLFGQSLSWMIFFGIVTGIIIVLISKTTSKYTKLSEDSAFAGFYIVFLAIGNLIISLSKTKFDIACFLFGSIFSISDSNLLSIVIINAISSVALFLIWKALIISTFDSNFLNYMPKNAPLLIKFFTNTVCQVIFTIILAINIIASFQGFGTLMSLSLILLPSLCFRFLLHKISHIIIASASLGIIASYIGLLLSFHFSWPVSSAIVIVLGVAYCLSILIKIISQRKIILITILVLMSANSFTNTYADGPRKINIICTFNILEDMIRNILRKILTQQDIIIDIKSIIPNHTDPHNYEPNAITIAAIFKSDIIILHGLGLEKRWLTDIAHKTTKKKTIIASKTVQRLFYEDGTEDPHSWLSVENAIKYVDVITESLISIIPEKSREIIDGADEYKVELLGLKKELTLMWQYAKKTKILCSNGDLSNYYAREYGVEIISIRSQNENTMEINPQYLIKLAEYCVVNDINIAHFSSIEKDFTIAIVNKINEILSQSHDISKESKGISLSLKPIATDFLGRHSTYIEMMRGITQILLA